MNKGFSLVELSIVLVILGLLTGGILTGQNLIRAAELRALSTEYQNHVTAVNTFRDKYFAIPGDMRDATRFWGKDNVACTTDTGTTTIPGTCNGDGDGVIEGSATPAVTAEMFQFWKHLALAGLVEGSYTGLAGPSTAVHAIISENVPASKLSNVGWTAYSRDIGTGDEPEVPIGNHFRVGVGNNQTTVLPFLKPEEQWNIDTKMDDGKPARGRLMVRYMTNGCTTAAAPTDLDAEYALTSTTILCSMLVKI